MGDENADGAAKDVEWDETMLRECFESTKSYLQLVTTLSEAGSSWSHHWAALLARTPYGPVADRFLGACQDIEASVSKDTNQVLTDVIAIQEKLAQNGRNMSFSDQTKSASSNKPGSESLPNDGKLYSSEEFKIVAKNFVSLVTLHCQIFIKASESVSQFSNLKYTEDSLGVPVAPEHDSSLHGAGHKVIEDSSCKPETTKSCGSVARPADANKQVVVGSPSGLRKLSSFLSKLGRSGSSPSPTDLSQSLFYVDMPEQTADAVISERRSTKQKSTEHTAGGEQVSHNTTGASNTRDSISQEELDSVIDFLSGFKVPMQTIHEHTPTQPHTNSRVVGSQLNHHYKENSDYYSQMMTDRQTGKAYPQQKTNTWPYRPASKAAAMVEMSSPYSAFGLGDTAMADPEYWRYLNAVSGMKHSNTGSSGNASDVLGGRSAWSTAGTAGGDAAPLNHSWPHQVMGQDAYDVSGRGWSCVTGDSSSSSDDSSNGEVPWMIGLDLMNSVNSKRRHSSGEDGLMPTNHGYAGVIRPNPVDSRPRSVEDLLEPKSNKTWPPKQPWMKGQPQSNSKEEENTPEGSSGQPPLQPQPYHAPLTMQWSDPLTNRPLSTWGTGLNPSLSNQSMTNYGSGVL